MVVEICKLNALQKYIKIFSVFTSFIFAFEKSAFMHFPFDVIKYKFPLPFICD